MNRPKRQCTMARNDESNLASKRRRQEKSTPLSFETLPADILIKIIELLPVAQWPVMERVHPNIRDVVYTAWKSLKEIDIQRDLLPHRRIKLDGEKKFQMKRIAIVKKLFERSPNLIDIAVGCSRIETPRNLRTIMDQFIEFEKLQRIDFGGDCVTTSSLSDFLRKSASRDQLKEIVNIERFIYMREDHLSIAFDNGNNDKPLRLETINFGRSSAKIPWNFLAKVDVTRLTAFRLIDHCVPQRLLANFLNRTPQLRQLSFDFTCRCKQGGNMPQHRANAVAIALDANKRIILAIARMEGLESLIMVSSIGCTSTCACGNFDQHLMGLLITLGHRQSFKELGMAGQLTKLATMNIIAPVIPKVESLRLKINNITTPLLDVIFMPQSNLRELRMYVPYRSPDTDLFHIINYVMQNASTLKSLSLESRSKIISHDRLKALGGLTELCELKLASELTYLDDAVVKVWTDGFGTNLTRLDMRNSGLLVAGDVLLKMIEKSPNLKTFIVEKFSFTTATLKKMAALSPKVEKVRFIDSKVTKVGLQNVIDGFRYLKKLTIGKYRGRDVDLDEYKRSGVLPGF